MNTPTTETTHLAEKLQAAANMRESLDATAAGIHSLQFAVEQVEPCGGDCDFDGPDLDDLLHEIERIRRALRGASRIIDGYAATLDELGDA